MTLAHGGSSPCNVGPRHSTGVQVPEGQRLAEATQLARGRPRMWVLGLDRLTVTTASYSHSAFRSGKPDNSVLRWLAPLPVPRLLPHPYPPGTLASFLSFPHGEGLAWGPPWGQRFFLREPVPLLEKIKQSEKSNKGGICVFCFMELKISGKLIQWE